MVTNVDMPRALQEVQSILGIYRDIRPTGSVYTNGEGADLDVLVHGTHADCCALFRAGFNQCANTEYGDASSAQWTALRRGDVNVLLCYCPELFNRWAAAAEVCRWVGSTTKAQRVVIHEIVKNLASVEVAIERATVS